MTRANKLYDTKYYTIPVEFHDAMRLMALDDILMVKYNSTYYYTQYIHGKFRIRKSDPSANWKEDESSNKFWREDDDVQFYAADVKLAEDEE